MRTKTGLVFSSDFKAVQVVGYCGIITGAYTAFLLVKHLPINFSELYVVYFPIVFDKFTS